MVIVPGNLLLSGEYAVTSPGGLGVALALAPSLHLRIRPAAAFSFSGSAGKRRLGGMRLVRAVIQTVAEEYCVKNLEARTRCALHADSSALYAKDGRKLGYGSSAALAVGLTTVFLSRLGILKRLTEQEARGTIVRAALAAHRLYQGGGSGYDVYASVYGGLGLFTGGEHPTWAPLPIGGFPRPLFLVRGGDTALSMDAARDFASWSAGGPKQAERFLRSSNAASAALARAIREAERAPSSGEPGCVYPTQAFVKALDAARVSGLRIGRVLGRDPESLVSADAMGVNLGAGVGVRTIAGADADADAITGASMGGGAGAGAIASTDAGLGARLQRARAGGYIAKASGAGGELGFAFRAAPPYTSSDDAPEIQDIFENVKIACEGVRWW